MVLPFLLLLLSIAILPLLAAHFWEHHYGKISVGLAVGTVAAYFFVMGEVGAFGHALVEYFSFICLIGSLFVVAGGIHITVKGEATPVRNVVFLSIGSILSNLIGTTGASMLLIRPWLRMNKYRITAFHVVFFIFIVSNVSGCLTPIGDPPLFIGYLKGVPFFWTLEHLLKPWMLTTGLLLFVFYIFDLRNFSKAPSTVREKEAGHEQFKVEGLINVLFLAIILGAVFISQPPFLREALMLGAAIASYFFTPRKVHEANHFNIAPLKEVGWLFLGIFVTMVPALHYLEANAGTLGISSPWQFYWLTGTLSAVLDNAPTYLAFLTTELGLSGLSVDVKADVLAKLASDPSGIVAISAAAVFFGAMTYIGNGPNLLVKSIAEHAGAKTPSFFGYILFFSLPILLPILALTGYIWFWGVAH